MIASFVHFALSPNTQLDEALACFSEHAEDLPLAHRLYASPRHWSAECMAGTLKRTIDGDMTPWPRSMRSAVAAAVAAARDALAAGRPRRAQAAAYAAARSNLYEGDINSMLATRLARQMGSSLERPLARDMVSRFRELSPRASFLAIRGATNSICSGARMQVEGAR